MVSVSNDLVTDQRVERVCTTLMDMDYDILLVGRRLPNSRKFNRKYKVKRMRLLFNKGPLFYLELNIRLFCVMVFARPEVLLSNDLDTLLANYLYHKLSFRKTELYYDSHEYFTEVPELIGRKSRKIWLKIEQSIFPKLENVYTVGERIANVYEEKYGVTVKVVRNLPKIDAEIIEGELLDGQRKLIYQGAVNMGRGIECMVRMMVFLTEYKFYIFGDGDIQNDIAELIIELGVGERVYMKGRVGPDALRSYTAQCDLGLSFEEDLGLSYRYALPNKMFDYIHAGVPVLVSDLPEMRSIINSYDVGEVKSGSTPKEVAAQVRSICESEDKYSRLVDNCNAAKNELNWQKEEEILKELFRH